MSCRFQSPGSLEMLLDTMCNTFGGIILIALLISLVARDNRLQPQATPRGASTATRLPETERDLARAKAAAAELARDLAGDAAARIRLAGERERLRARLGLLDEESARLKARVLAEAANASQTIQDLAARLEQERRQLERELPAEITRQRELTRERERLQAHAALAREQLRERTRPEVRQLRFPREHPTGKRPCDVIVRHGRLYPVHLFPQGLKQRNTATLRWRPAEGGGEYVEPLPGLGMDPVRDREAVEAFFRQVSAGEYYLVFQVYQDSFGAFGLAKQMAVNRGFETGWVPLQNLQPLKAASGGQPRAPQ